MPYNQTELYKCATPETKLIFDHLYLKFGDSLSISRFCYTGVINSTFWLTFTARRLFLALYVSFGHGGAVLNTSSPQVSFYDETDTIFYQSNQSNIMMNDTLQLVRYNGMNIYERNIYFSRILKTHYDYINFIGYEIRF